MGLRLLAIGAVIYSSKFLRKQSAIVRTARARRGNDIDPYCWPQYERTSFMATASKPFSSTSPGFKTARDIIDQATNPVHVRSVTNSEGRHHPLTCAMAPPSFK